MSLHLSSMTGTMDLDNLSPLSIGIKEVMNEFRDLTTTAPKDGWRIRKTSLRQGVALGVDAEGWSYLLIIVIIEITNITIIIDIHHLPTPSQTSS